MLSAGAKNNGMTSDMHDSNGRVSDNQNMVEHIQLIDAINIRTSVRDFEPEPIDDDQARQLEMTIDAVNTLSELGIQLVRDQPAVFAAANASGHLRDAADFIAVVGPNDDRAAEERAGFYTQRVVLTATLRGLGTCWVGGSLDRGEAVRHCRISQDERLYLAVIVGYPADHLAHLVKSYDELSEFQRTHRPSKSFKQFTASMADDERANAPRWFTNGVEAAMKAPSAMNLQPVLFSYNDADDTAVATLDPKVRDGEAFIDLGIAKLHFQIGAGQGTWAWGEGGLFIHH